jgi:hypothetical protein
MAITMRKSSGFISRIPSCHHRAITRVATTTMSMARYVHASIVKALTDDMMGYVVDLSMKHEGTLTLEQNYKIGGSQEY